MGKAKIIIVNGEDKIIGYKKRGTLDLSDIYRVSALWIQNSKGEILLAQRSFDKKTIPENGDQRLRERMTRAKLTNQIL